MSTRQTRYDEEFKRTLVDLYHNSRTQSALCKKYGVSLTALSRWIKQYSTVETDDDQLLTAKQISELLKRNPHLEEENMRLKKRLPSSRHTRATIRCCS